MNKFLLDCNLITRKVTFDDVLQEKTISNLDSSTDNTSSLLDIQHTKQLSLSCNYEKDSFNKDSFALDKDSSNYSAVHDNDIQTLNELSLNTSQDTTFDHINTPSFDRIININSSPGSFFASRSGELGSLEGSKNSFERVFFI
jgi:hypothetical protein